jgi:hypothetical protein
MPLKELVCDFRPERDTDILRSIETLERLNRKPVAELLKPADGFVPLFNGKDFTGWEGLTDEFWSVKDGAIVGSTLPDGIKFNTFLCSKKEYKDFELKFKVKLIGKGWAGNSGVQIRSKIKNKEKYTVAGPQADMGGRYWGSLWGEDFGGMMKEAPVDEVNKVLKANDFNDYSIKCVGKHVTIKVNGVTSVDGDFDKMPDEGIIAWQLHAGNGMEVTFKDIKFTDLSAAGSADEFVPLFNGKDLKGWKTHAKQPGNWRVKGGMLIGSGPSVTSHLYTERGDYTDFHLRLEARINQAGNSGVYFRTPFGPTRPANQPRWLKGYNAKIDKNRLGGFLVDGPTTTGPLVRSRAPAIPPGQWLTLEVIVQGNHIVVKTNGETTAEYTDKKRCFASGHIALQQHSPQTVVEFRKIDIKELPARK